MQASKVLNQNFTSGISSFVSDSISRNALGVNLNQPAIIEPGNISMPLL
jgi:hypothetical protein